MLGALIGGAAAIGSSLIGKSAANKASKAAAKAAEENAKVQREIYGENKAALSPFLGYGTSAGNALSERLFAPAPGTPDYAGYVDDYLDLQAAWNDPNTQAAWGGDKAAWGAQHWKEAQARGGEGRELDMVETPPEQEFMAMERPELGMAPAFSMDQNPSQRYYDEMADSTRSINARAGAVRGYYSGGRAKELQTNADKLWRADEQRRFENAMARYRTDLDSYNTRNVLTQGAFESDRGFGAGRYDTQNNNLFNLLNLGASSASALAGVGQNYANALTNNNNAAASVKANAALSSAGQTNNVLSGLAYGLGSGGIFGNQSKSAAATSGGSYTSPAPIHPSSYSAYGLNPRYA